MPPVPITLQPGVDAQSTPAQGATGWNESRNIRFFEGLAQKSGGFQHFTDEVAGGGRPVELRAWAALSGVRNLAIAGENRISLFASDVVTDITPVTENTLAPIWLSTVAGSPIITINDPLNAPAMGGWVRIRAPISSAGVIINGPYEVMSIVDPTHFTITATVNATATLTDAGAPRVFTTALDSRVVAVTLADHGLFSGEVDRITDPVVVGGIALEGNYVASVIDPNNYTILAATAATSTDTVGENGGNIAYSFFSPTANPAQNPLEVESVDLDNWGEFLVVIPQGGAVFVWKPTDGPNSPAQNVPTAPQANTSGFVSAQQQILVMCGSVNFATGLFDPLLVRWSDAGDYTQFTPLPSNQAGSFRLQLGSVIVAGLAVAGRGLVWTDLGLYVMQYESVPLVWGFQPIGVNCGLIGPKAMGTLGETVVWMSQNQFYVLGGSPQVIPCSVWDLVFPNIDPANKRQSVCVTNAFFGEIAWYVPQLDGTTTKARLNISAGTWDYTIIQPEENTDRSAGIDQNVFGPPIGASPEGIVYREETGTDADTLPLPWRLVTGIAMIAQGDQVAFFRQIVPDIKFSNDQFAGPGTVKMLVYVYRDPQAAPRVKGPYLINARTRSIPSQAC